MTGVILDLPATSRAILRAVNIALNALPKALTSDAARCLLVATALQETGGETRYQHNGGPARGLWQA